MRARFAVLLCTFVVLGERALAQCPANSQPPVGQSPNGSNLTANAPITFSWTPSTSSAVTGYSVILGTAGSPATTTGCSANSANANSCGVNSLPVGQYSWTVKATTNTANCELASTIKQFTVGCLSSAPSIQSPPDNAQNVSQNPTLTWNPVSGADQYDVYFDQAGYGGCTGQPLFTTSTTSFRPSGTLIPNRSYEWRVVAKKTGTSCPFTTTSCATFTTTGPSVCNPPGSFNLTGPANGSIASATPTLSWSAASGVDKYLVHFGTQNPPAPATNDARLSGSQTSFTFGQPLPAGTYYWSVDAYPACSTTVKTSSSVFSFTVAPALNCPTTPATLIAPASGATDVPSNVTFQWTAVGGATAYKLYIAEAGDNAGDLSGTTTATSLTRLVPDGAVTWWVATSFANCPDIVSAKSTFISGVQAACGTATTLTSPADNATLTSPVTLTWSAVSGASGYRLWISFNGSAPLLAARTSNSTTSQQVSLSSGTGEWYVETQFGNSCDSTFSAHRHFNVGTGATCDTHKAATLSSPAGGAQVTSPVTFSWNGNDPTALLYRVWVSMNGEAFADIGFTKDTHLQHDFSGTTGNGLWFVETYFENCTAVKSAAAAFVIPTPGCVTASAGPQLLSPAANATVASPVTLTWTAVPRATEYRVYASFDGGAIKVLAKTTDTSISGPLSPGVVNWLVEAVFDGCPSLRSATSQFTVARAQTCPADGPTLVAPADGATNLTSPVRFAWTAVSGASGYAVLLRNNDGADTRIAQTLQTEATVEIPDGQNEWWVVAFVNGCNPVESKHFRFTVTENDCTSERPILFTPADGAIGLSSPVRFQWSRIPDAVGYKVWAAAGDQGESVIGTTADNKLTADVPSGIIRWRVEVLYKLCPSLSSAVSSFTVLKTAPPCTTPGRPLANGPGQVASNSEYTIRWSTTANATSYEVQESATSDFSTATTQVVTDQAAKFTHVSAQSATRWLYRVRAISSCSDDRGPYSPVVVVTVLLDAPQRRTSVEVGTQSTIRQTIMIPGATPNLAFTARTDKSWATVTPATGTLGPGGFILTITSDPAALKLGTNTATVLFSFSLSSKGTPKADDTPPATASVPVSVTTVTPVTSGGKNTPLPNSLIIPAVGHATGANDSLFESDVRIANTTAQAMKYQLNFTLTHTDASQSGSSTTIQVDPGATMALDDILTSFFGAGSDGASALGVLEIRPLTTTQSSFTAPPSTVSVQTVASSRTYNTTATGTFGQFIPAIPFSSFIGQSSDSSSRILLSLQQIAQSSAYRTNFGIVEGAGEPASVLVHVFNNQGVEVAPPIPISLMPGEHQQRNLLAENGITLTDGRFEVEVVSTTGKVTAYASVIDNLTNDPLMVFPVLKGGESASRYVIPGVADINNGIASWRSDIRLFNPTSADVTATLAYFPQPGNLGASGTKQVTIPAGQVLAVDNALQSLYTLTNSGGSLLVTTAASSKLVVTARTYNQTSNGTYGQFIPAVTPAGSIGLSDNRVLQLLQLESSDKMRTNLGFVETSGSPVTIEVSAIPSDSKVAAKTQIALAANQFLQVSLAQFGLGTAYNARVTVKVLSGSGRVTAYGSVIDAATQDPTYVPAQ